MLLRSANSALISFFAMATGLIISCSGHISKEKVSSSVDTSQFVMEGAKLSAKYCGNCHTHTPPDLLPKRIWKDEVLPRMGAFMGIYEHESREKLIEQGAAKKIVMAANVYPERPVLDSVDWKKIKLYYINEAPDRLEQKSSAQIEVRDVFKATTPKIRINPPMSTMIDFKEASGMIYHGDVKKDYSTLNIFDPQGEVVQTIALKAPPVKVREKDGDLWTLLMGKFTSTDAPDGSLIRITKRGNSEKYNSLEILIDGLIRPVDLDYADFDGDGDEDVVIAQFGNWAGRLEWFENRGEEGYKPHILINKTGATQVIAEDLNADGHPDIMAMIAQGDESIYALLNEGDGKFYTKKLIQVPPTYGSVYFNYYDFDSDGIKDILHVSGDNADYDAILKPYHGIRFYKGKADLTFKEVLFYPQHGAYKAMPADFDGDGDLDIATISFFPDYSGAGKEALMILENKSVKDSLHFEGYAIQGYNSSRWVVMDVGDINKDQKPDLVVASFVVQDPYGDQKGIREDWMDNSPMYVIFDNQIDENIQ